MSGSCQSTSTLQFLLVAASETLVQVVELQVVLSFLLNTSLEANHLSIRLKIALQRSLCYKVPHLYCVQCCYANATATQLAIELAGVSFIVLRL